VQRELLAAEASGVQPLHRLRDADRSVVESKENGELTPLQLERALADMGVRLPRSYFDALIVKHARKRNIDDRTQLFVLYERLVAAAMDSNAAAVADRWSSTSFGVDPVSSGSEAPAPPPLLAEEVVAIGKVRRALQRLELGRAPLTTRWACASSSCVSFSAPVVFSVPVSFRARLTALVPISSSLSVCSQGHGCR
jgi:hypothetical protein